MPLMFFLDEFRDLEFTGNLGLAEATSRHRDPVFLLLIPTDNSIAIFETFILVVTFFVDRPSRAPGRTGFAGLVEIVQAVGPVMGINLF